MSLPFIKKNPPSPKREYLFALELDHHSVKSAIWSVINAKPQVLSVGKTVSWDDQSEDSLISASDDSLSDAVLRLDSTSQVQPDKVILGVPADWMAGDKIAPQFLQLIKQLCHKLSLKPVGFVVTSEAVIRFVQATEGVPPTAILLGVWSAVIEVSLVRMGKIQGTQLVRRSNQIVADTVEGLSRFPKTDMLPSRILLYDSGSDLEDIRQQLLAHPWQAPQTHLPFLHFPKIEILPVDYTIKAISLAGGSEVAQAIGLVSATEPIVAAPATPSSSETVAEDLGFFAPNMESAVEPQPEEAEIISAPDPQPATYLAPAPVFHRPRPKFNLSFPSARLPRFNFRFPVFNVSFVLIGLILALLLIPGSLFAAYWYIPRADVVVTVVPQPIDHQFDLVARTKPAASDNNQLVLPATTSEANASDQKTVPATGSKIVGDKAVGKVTIINGTSAARTFPAGTVLSSSSGLKFSLNSDTKVASASGTADPNSYQPGKTDADITAMQIGSDSNLSAGTEFKIGSFASLDYVAKNQAALSGGTSREVKAVSKDDVNTAKTQLTTALKDQARQKLMDSAKGDQVIVPESISLQVISESSDHKDGDVADQVTVSQSVKATAISFVKSQLDDLVNQQIQPLIPKGYQQTGNVTPSFSVKKVDKDSVTLSARVASSLLPQLDQAQIISNITGKNPAQARDYLATLPGVKKVTYTFTPRLPDRLVTLPHVSNHIKISVVSE